MSRATSPRRWLGSVQAAPELSPGPPRKLKSPKKSAPRPPPRLARNEQARRSPHRAQQAQLELALYRLNSAFAKADAGSLLTAGFDSAVRQVVQAVAHFSGEGPSQWASTRKWIDENVSSPRSSAGGDLTGPNVSRKQLRRLHILPAVGFECLTEEAIKSLRKLYDSVDDGDAELNRTETIRLLRTIGVITKDTTADMIDEIINDMDRDNSGSVDLSEFLGAIDRSMLENTAKERAALIKAFIEVRSGPFGTSWRSPANVFWLMLNGITIMTVTTIIAGLVYFKGLLVPLTMAYFFTFVLGPLFDLFYQRPLLCGGTFCLADEKKIHGSSCCSVRHDGRVYRDGNTPLGISACAPQQRALAEIFLLGRLPQSIALLATFFVAFAGVFLLAWAVYDQINGLLRTPEGEDSEFVLELYQQLKHLREYLRTTHFVEIEELTLKNTSVENPTHYNISGALESYGGVIASVNEFVLIMLLCVYMLSTRTFRTVADKIKAQERPHEMELMEKIETSIRHYVILKTKISFVTGLAVMLSLMLLRVKLWLVWGVLTFVLNFIPNVGSLIAMFMPLPIALADTTLSPLQKILAFLIPGAIQGYVGNVLEPSLFGKSLNLTDISVLSTLVLWYSLWGVYGAILSVPLLGVMKILLDAADFPLAKMFLQIIRQENAVDEGLERTRTGGLDNIVLLPGIIEFGEKPAISTLERGDFLKGIAIGTVAARQHQLDMDQSYDFERAQHMGEAVDTSVPHVKYHSKNYVRNHSQQREREQSFR